MHPTPIAENPDYRGSGKLKGTAAIITGGDSGIGRAVAIAFAKEGANVGIIYLSEDEDAEITLDRVRELGADCHAIKGDVGNKAFCQQAVNEFVDRFGRLDILVNNAAEQHPTSDIREISEEQLEKTFRTNIFAYFFMTQAAMDHLEAGASIINTTSVTAYKGSPSLLDYSSTKGAIVTFTRSLSLMLASKEIRVNGVAPGPVWTPLIPGSFDEEKVQSFGADVPLARAGQPDEIAPSYVFLASQDSSFMTGQVLHPNGGSVINT